MRRAPLYALYAADAISLSGNAIAQIAIPWFVLTETGSATLTALVVFFNFVPIVLAAFFGGVVVDRLGFRTTSVVADLASSAAVAAIPLLHTTVGIELWQLMALVFVGALLDAPGATARAALFPDVVELAGVPMERASGFRAGIQQGSQLVGAPLGGVLVAAFGAIGALWLDAASFLVSAALVVVFVARPQAARRARSPVASSPSSPRDCGSSGAARWSGPSCSWSSCRTWSRPRPRWSWRYSPRRSTAALPTSASWSVFSAGRRSPEHWSTARSATACLGGAPSSSASRSCRSATWRWRRCRRSRSRSSPSRWPGFAAGPINPLLFTVQTEIVPSELRGRVFGAVRAGAWAAIPLGILLGGVVVAAVGVAATFLAMGVLLALVVGYGFFNPAFREMDRRPVSTRDEGGQQAAPP